MTEPNSMTDQVLNLVVDQMSNHQSILADFSARLEPFANELIDQWTRSFHDTATRIPLSAATIAQNEPASLVRALFGELKLGNLRQALAGLAQWGSQLAHLGLRYDLAIRLAQEYQRATVDFVIRVYADDPQMPLVFDALDDLFHGVVTVIGAMYAEKPSPGAQNPTPPEVSTARWKQAYHQFVLGYLTEGMTHALNNLLATILGRTQLLLEHTRDFEIRDELEEIQNAASGGARVIRRIQNYALAGSSLRQSVDVNLLLRDASEITHFVWRDRAELQGIVIDVVKDFAEVPPILANPSELRRAFVALLLNAIEAVPEGGLITLRTERKGNQVIVSFSDNGAGMRGDVRMGAPQSFFTTKEPPHLGLGLTLVANIIADHSGTLTLDSQPHSGTLVTVSLPVAQDSPAEKGDSTMLVHRPANVLVIDNDSSVRTLLARLLKIQGHTVVASESGSAGIAAFKTGKFDAVLTDLGMPEVSGWDVAREIKKLDPHILIALTTGWPIDLSPEELKEKNVDRIINKPFDLPLLFSLIEEAVSLNDRQ